MCRYLGRVLLRRRSEKQPKDEKQKIKQFLEALKDGVDYPVFSDDHLSFSTSHFSGPFLPHHMAMRLFSNLGMTQVQQEMILWKVPYPDERVLHYFIANFIAFYSIPWFQKQPGRFQSRLRADLQDSGIAKSGFALQPKVFDWLSKYSTKYLSWLYNTSYGSVDHGNGTSPVEHIHSTTRGVLSRARNIKQETVVKIITMRLVDRTLSNLEDETLLPAYHGSKAMKRVSMTFSKALSELWTIENRLLQSSQHQTMSYAKDCFLFFSYFFYNSFLITQQTKGKHQRFSDRKDFMSVEITSRK